MAKNMEEIRNVICQGPYTDTWESLSGYKVPEWYENLKFGLFLHWGVYSVPAFGSEWYSRNMYIQGSREFNHHVETYGPHTQFGYKDFIPMFRAERFDPESWAELFTQAGAQYVIPVAEHHDGFQMYKSDISHWNAYEMGPHRDVLGEITSACRAKGLVTGASSHRIEHWFFMGHGREFESDIHDPMQLGDFYWPAMQEREHYDVYSEPAPTQEFLEDWLMRTCEIIDRYQPRMIYFDWWIMHSSAKPYIRMLAAYYYNRSQEWGGGVINYKQDSFVFGTAVPDVERGQYADIKPFVWQSDTSTALNSWCYTEGNAYRTAEELVCDLIDIVSKNGRLLLNAGPKADGTFGEEDTQILRGIGEWLKVNGEAIYGTHVWKQYGEGPTKVAEGQFQEQKGRQYTPEDFRFTTKEGRLYATAMRESSTGLYCIRALRGEEGGHDPFIRGIVGDVSVLGQNGYLEWSQDGEGLHICTDVHSDMPIVFRIEMA